MEPCLPKFVSPVRQIGPIRADFAHEIHTMAIVNRTPDSFFDQGKTFALDAAIASAIQAAAAGATIVDVGGVKFAPGEPLAPELEVQRVLPIVEAIVADGRAAVSVDTFQPFVAERVIDAGAAIINDTTGGAVDGMFRVVADSSAQIVITHSRARPRQEYPHPQYVDIAQDVRRALSSRIDAAVDAGIPTERIFIDAGADLNKNTLQTLELTRRLDEVAALNLPMVAAVSNKDFVGEAIDQPKDRRLVGTIAAATLSAFAGARILRMHDVHAALDTARFVEAVLGIRTPEHLIHNV